MPSPAPRRPHSALVQRVGDPGEGGDAGGTDALDDRRHAGGELIGVGRDSLASLFGGLGRVAGVSELRTLRLLPGESLAGPLGDQLALLLSEAGIQMKNERV